MMQFYVAGKTILVVQAHPDDADYYCGGTIARFAREGARIVYLICTDGSKGTVDRKVDPGRLVKTRRAEQQEANRILGVAETRFLSFKDLECPIGPELREQLVREYRSVQPEILMTFDPWKPYEFHPDHTTVGKEALYSRLAAKMPLSFPEHLKEGLDTVEIHEILMFKTDSPDFFVDVHDYLDAKRDAILAHTSQFGGVLREDADRFVRDITACDRNNHRYQEAFKRVSLLGMLS